MIHKQHHSWLATRSIGAEYSHPIETVFSAVIPTVGGCALFGRHPLVFMIWTIFRMEETYEAHSNYWFGNTWVRIFNLQSLIV